ncbi:hypothetical protein B0T25DRAFT_536960 [Lasiosphaeria hispida]|uniref:Uncharacterized protein n=1 Tax=Lasiosphaeria hispida TaxID=260671 RepID=A0AAJ0HKP3_9PEZI|nr:hypothetical protein B0T25DRAFT_536960 [Lasiosphaeria hispida]
MKRTRRRQARVMRYLAVTLLLSDCWTLKQRTMFFFSCAATATVHWPACAFLSTAYATTPLPLEMAMIGSPEVLLCAVAGRRRAWAGPSLCWRQWYILRPVRLRDASDRSFPALRD